LFNRSQPGDGQITLPTYTSLQKLQNLPPLGCTKRRRVSAHRKGDPMVFPGFIPLTELLGTLSPVVLVILAGAVAVILWEVAILLGALIAGLGREGPLGNGDHLNAV
jgi:hypothetical protein